MPGRCRRRVAVRIALLAIAASASVSFVVACGEGQEGTPGTTTRETETRDTETRDTDTVTTTTTGITNQPIALAGTEILIRGDHLYGLVTDSAGNRLGNPDPVSGFEIDEAPSASFTSASGGDSFFLRGDEAYEGSWTAAEDDEVRFLVLNYAADEISEMVATFPFAIRAGTALSLRLVQPADLGSLEIAVDEGGDGDVDRTVAFGERVVGAAASDHSQPVSRVAVEHLVDPNRGPIARVTVTATDRGGSGIGRIEYGLVPAGTSGVYTSPLELPAVGRIVVRAIDRAGNIQTPYSRATLSPSKG